MTGVIYSTVRETAIDRRDNGQKLSITGVLKILGLSKSGYYDFCRRKPSATQLHKEPTIKKSIGKAKKDEKIMKKSRHDEKATEQ